MGQPMAARILHVACMRRVRMRTCGNVRLCVQCTAVVLWRPRGIVLCPMTYVSNAGLFYEHAHPSRSVNSPTANATRKFCAPS